MKYFATDSHQFPDFGRKFKSGDIVELTPEDAKVFNGIHPGLLKPHEPAIDTPAPVVTPPAEPETPESSGFTTAEVTA